MGKIEDPQHAKGEGKTRGDQKEEGRPGDSAHELTEKDIERHSEHPKIKRNGIMEYWNNEFLKQIVFLLLHYSITPLFLFVLYRTTPVFFQISLTLASGRMT